MSLNDTLARGSLPKVLKIQFQLQRFEQWLMLRSRSVLAGLVISNVLVAALLVGFREAPVPTEPAVSSFAPEIQLSMPQIAAAPEQSLIEPAEPVAECRFWGPEASEDAFAGLKSELEQMGGVPHIVKSEIEGTPDYLVSVVGLRSIEQAKQIAKELTALNIESYVLRREDAQPALSVGVFSRQDLAETQQQRVQKLGYQVSVDALIRTQTVYNLWAHVVADTELYRSSIAPCPTIAHNT